MRDSKDRITEIFYLINNFCHELNTSLESHIIGKPAKKKPQMSKSEVKDIAAVGKSTIGWFYGFKLHLVVYDKGEILNFVITAGNVGDREPLKDEKFLKLIKGKLYADKGYISQKLTELLFIDGLHQITDIRNKMKNTLMELKDKILLVSAFCY